MLLAFVLSVVPLLPCGAASAGMEEARGSHSPRAVDDFPFARVAEEFAARYGLKEATTEAFEAYLEEQCLVLDLGAVRLHYPRPFLADKDRVENLKEAAGGILLVQDVLAQWAGAAPASSRGPALPSVQVLERWVKSWKSSALRQLADSPGVIDSPGELGAGDDEREASRSFQELMRSGSFLGATRPENAPVTVVLAPDRAEFVGLACFVGAIDESKRAGLWQPTVPSWSVFQTDGRIVLPGEHPSADRVMEDYTAGEPMDGRERTGFGQHVVTHVAFKICETFLGEQVDPVFLYGMAIDLVIEVFGENNARFGGAESGNTTAARSKFVRGGRSQGGRLPQNDADGPWRQGKGQRHFLGVLENGQKLGRKLAAKEKQKGVSPEAGFAIRSATDSRQLLAVAPFLSGPGQEIPDDYLADFLEFQRAYRTGFVYWLRAESQKASGKDASGEMFAELLRGLAAAGDEEDATSAAVQSVYSMPLSAAGADAGDHLEGRFLLWLSKS